MTTMSEHPQQIIDYYETALAPTRLGAANLADFIEAVRSDEFKPMIDKLRKALDDGDDDYYASAKRKLPAVSISGTCNGTPRKNAVEEGRFVHSGLLQLDFDAVDNIGWSVEEIVEILMADPRIVAALISPSGHGVKGIARIPFCQTKEEHAAAFAAARNFFKANHLKIDESCKDPVRLMFVSHDPNAWLDLTRTALFEPETDVAPMPSVVSSPPSDGLILRERKHGEFPTPPVSGIHTWVMEAAWWCRLDGMTEQDTINKLDAFNGTLRRLFQPNEVRDAVSKVFSTPMEKPATPAGTDTPEKLQELLDRAYALQFDVNNRPPPDETVLSIDDIPIGARGNLTVIQGKSKVGKSAVISAVIGAAVRGLRKANGDTLCLTWSAEATGSILHLDTEQSRADWHGLVLRGVIRGGVMDYSRLRSLPLIPFSRAERLKILKLAMAREHSTFGKVDIVILDGVADLCMSPNDEGESLELVAQLMALAQEFHTVIVCVLHENPGSEIGKTRGHLGSELNRKAFANIRIDKDGETGISTIYGADMRKRDIPKTQGFSFGWDDEKNMHVFLARADECKSMVRKEKNSAEATETMQAGRSYTYTDLVNTIIRKLDVSEKTAKRRITTWEVEGVIFKTTAGGYMLT